MTTCIGNAERAFLGNSECTYNHWHKRLGHPCNEKFMELKRKGMIHDINIIQKIRPNKRLCESCIIGKQSQSSSKNNKDKSHIKNPLKNIHSDICGPINPCTYDGKR